MRVEHPRMGLYVNAPLTSCSGGREEGRRQFNYASEVASQRSIAQVVLPWPGWLNRSREVINGGTSTTFRSRSSR